MNRRDFAKLSAVTAAGAAQSAPAQEQTYDVVIYGGTAAGVMAAVAVARQGLKTALLEPRDHVGGMATGGLSRTDVGRREVLGGLALEFYMRVGQRYDVRRFDHFVAWFYEPRVGESVMLEMLHEADVDLLFRHRLKEKTGTVVSGGQVKSIEMENGAKFSAKIFMDCTYEGDLMAQAGVKYTWGRESTKQYGESLAGVRDKTPKHQFLVDIPARDATGKLYPEISSEPKGTDGAADKRVQAYNFRIIATDNPNVRVPWPEPTGYDPKRYELLALLLAAQEKKLGRPNVFHELTLIAPIPNRKADFNNQGAFSTDYIGKSWDYPDGSYARRTEIWEDHVRYVQGFYYFLATDKRVPPTLQQEVGQWGLCADEYEDSSHWPHQLYVREGRRMIGEYVVLQKDLQTDLRKPDVIGMGSYNSDSHNLHRFANSQGFVENEGDMQVAVKPYQIPYRVMLPKPDQLTNLFVPVCFSASHVAYSSLRMEPQYMIIGHCAGVAAKLALEAGKPIQQVDVSRLQKILLDEGAVFEYNEIPQWSAIQRLRPRVNPKGPARWHY